MIVFSNGFDELPGNIKNLIRDANLFFSKEYEKNVIVRGQRLYYVWSESHVLVARVKKRLFLTAAVLESEPFKYNDGEGEKEFLTLAMKELKRNGVQWTVCATTARFQDYPEGSVVAPAGNYIVDLTLSEEELWSNVHSKHRNSIRRGEKANLKIRIGGAELLSDYVPISTETYSRSSKTTPGFEYYNNLMKSLDNNICIFMSYKDGQPQSGGMFYYNKQMAYYLHGASIGRPEPGSTNYLLWKAMLYFKEKGVKQFSFVGYHYDPEAGSKLDGIQRFKERFGGQLEQCFNFRYVQNYLAYKIYCLAMQIKAKKPFEKYQDAIDKQVEKYPELNGGRRCE